MAINHDINSKWTVRTRARVDPADRLQRQGLKRPEENTAVLISPLKRACTEPINKELLKLRLPLDSDIIEAIKTAEKAQIAAEALLALLSSKETVKVLTLESSPIVEIRQKQTETEYFLEYLKIHAMKRLSFRKLIGTCNLSSEEICNLMTIFRKKYEGEFFVEKTNRNLMLTLSDASLKLEAKQPWIDDCRENYRSVY